MNDDLLLPVLQLIDVMKKNIQNKSFLRSLKAIARKIRNLLKKQVLDKTIYTNLDKLRNKKLPNSYEKVIENIILPIMNIYKFIDPSKAKVEKSNYLVKLDTFQIPSNLASMSLA